jgi:hypothetical protein
MKKHSLTKAILAAAAVAVTLLATAPAHAFTSWVRGGMWASTGGEPNNVVYPDGITSNTTPTQAAAVADSVAGDYHEIGVNFVRIDVDPATISSNWPVVQAYVNELVTDGLYVDICGSYNTTNNVIVNLTNWKNMWLTIDGVYKNNNMVYYEPANEPYGYDFSGMTNVYSAFLNSYGIQKAHGYIILQCNNNDVPALGAVYTDCLLAFHEYWGPSITTESGWASDVANRAGVCANRCIVTEYGAPTVTNTVNYQVFSSDNFITYLRGLTTEFRALPMGSIWFPAHQNNGNLKRMFNGIGGPIFNRSALNRMQYGWNFFTPTAAPGCDFNTNGTTAYSVFRPSNQRWYIYPGVGGIAYGASTDVAVPADYNGDGLAEPSVWRVTGGLGYWYVYPSVNPTQYGTNGDIPVPGDYAGSGNAQMAVWRPSNGTWYVSGVGTTQWGLNGDIPVPGYYNYDGHLDYAVYRPSNNKWYVYGGVNGLQFGQAGDIPVPGDYIGNGTTQIAVYRPSDGTWRINGVSTNQFGNNNDVPVPGDYNNSGFTQMAKWSKTNFVWSVSGGGTTTYGTTSDVPLPLPYAIRHYSLGYSN